MSDDLNPVDVAIGARVRLRREAMRITQQQLAVAIGVTFQQVQKYERGVNRISASRLMQIAEALHASTTLFLKETVDGEVELAVDLLDTPGALELLRAYRAIRSPRHREGLLAMARSLDAV